jgi:hypothetical protein
MGDARLAVRLGSVFSVRAALHLNTPPRFKFVKHLMYKSSRNVLPFVSGIGLPVGFGAWGGVAHEQPTLRDIYRQKFSRKREHNSRRFLLLIVFLVNVYQSKK